MPMPKANIPVGSIYETNGGTSCTVLKYNSNIDVVIKFNDKFGYTKSVTLWDLRKGSVKNPYDRNVQGIGYLGVGDYLPYFEGKDTLCYVAWVNMLRRCYSESSRKKNPSYVGCTVCEEWLCFQEFAKWYYSQVGANEGFQVDKDLLVKGNKVYSPDTCCMLPKDINALISYKYKKDNAMPTGVAKRSEKRFRACLNIFGKNKILGTFDTVEEASLAYKVAKEDYVKLVADKWRGSIDEAVYESLMNWTVDL